MFLDSIILFAVRRLSLTTRKEFVVEYQLFFVSFDDILCTYTQKDEKAHGESHSDRMQEWVIQIPSIPILVSVTFPSLLYVNDTVQHD